MATAGFVLALASVLFSWSGFIGWIIWVLGLVFSCIGLSRAKSMSGNGRGLAIAGIILSLIGVIMILFLGTVILGALGLSSLL